MTKQEQVLYRALRVPDAIVDDGNRKRAAARRILDRARVAPPIPMPPDEERVLKIERTRMEMATALVVDFLGKAESGEADVLIGGYDAEADQKMREQLRGPLQSGTTDAHWQNTEPDRIVHELIRAYVEEVEAHP